MRVLTIEGRRDVYSPEQMIKYGTCTVGELIGMLSDFDYDTPIMLDNDNGYTFGAIGYSSIGEYYIEEEED